MKFTTNLIAFLAVFAGCSQGEHTALRGNFNRALQAAELEEKCQVNFDQCMSVSNNGGGGLSGVKCLNQFPNCAKCEGGFNACQECVEGFTMRSDGTCGVTIDFEDYPLDESNYQEIQMINPGVWPIYEYEYMTYFPHGIRFVQHWWVLDKERYLDAGRWNVAKSHTGSGPLVGAVHNGGYIRAPIHPDGYELPFDLKTFKILSSAPDPIPLYIQIHVFQGPYVYYGVEVPPGETFNIEDLTGAYNYRSENQDPLSWGDGFEHVQSLYFGMNPSYLMFIDDIVVN